MLHQKRWIVAFAVGVYLYFLLPATAALFYEFYHLVEFEPLYLAYGAFKAAGYYFGTWEYKWLACLMVAACIGIAPSLIPGRKTS